MKIKSLVWVVGISMLFASWAAQAGTVSGKLVGVSCASHGEMCPTDKLDPHLVLEPDFVLVKDDGSFVFLPNLPRAVKVRYVLQQIMVQGEHNSKYNIVKVNEMKVNGKSVWSPKMQHEAAAALLSGQQLNY